MYFWCLWQVINIALIKSLNAGPGLKRGSSPCCCFIGLDHWTLLLLHNLVNCWVWICKLLWQKWWFQQQQLSILLPGNCCTETMGSEQHCKAPGWHLCCPLLARRCSDASPAPRCRSSSNRKRRWWREGSGRKAKRCAAWRRLAS